MNIPYPTIPHDKRKNVKLKINDIRQIKYLFFIEKCTVEQIANQFNVALGSIRYHLDPDFKEKKLSYSRKYNKIHWRSDELFRNRNIRDCERRIKERRKEFVYLQFEYQQHKEYFKKLTPEQRRNQSLKYELSEKGQKIRKNYRSSEHCKIIKRKSQTKYRNTEKGKETQRRFKIKQKIKTAMSWF